MSDYTELKRLAESLPQLPWSYEANGFILAWDGTERSRCENVGGFYYVCEGVSNFREYLLALEPAKVLALIAENEELGRYLCTCRDCGGEGSLHTGDWHSYGHMEPPEPVMEKCGECDGTGLLGEIQDLYQVITDRYQLRAEVAGLRTGYEAYEQVNAELKDENERLRKFIKGLSEYNEQISYAYAALGHGEQS